MLGRAKFVISIVNTVPSMLCCPWNDVSQEKRQWKMLLKFHFHAWVTFFVIIFIRIIIIHLVELFLALMEGKLEAWAGSGKPAVPALFQTSQRSYLIFQNTYTNDCIAKQGFFFSVNPQPWIFRTLLRMWKSSPSCERVAAAAGVAPAWHVRQGWAIRALFVQCKSREMLICFLSTCSWRKFFGNVTA